MKAYKLFKVRKNGTIGSLFINAEACYPIGEWMEAQKNLKKKGFAYRPGWHCLRKPEAPHLKNELSNGQVRKFFEVEIEDFKEFERPENQGGKWFLAQRIKIIKQI